MKIIIFTDVHANLPALEAMLSAVEAEGYDLLVHVGDAVAIGPYPAEALDLLLSRSNIRFIKGNHDQWLAEGLPNPIPVWMSTGEMEHQNWTHSQIDSTLKSIVSEWPLIIQENFEGVPVAFMHYRLDKTNRDFESVLKDPTEAQLETLFQPFSETIIFYGHTHVFSDKQAASRYINPGSLGCFSKPLARYTVLEIKNRTYNIEHRAVEYDDRDLWQTFEERKAPERQFLYKAFFGGRFESRPWPRIRLTRSSIRSAAESAVIVVLRTMTFRQPSRSSKMETTGSPINIPSAINMMLSHPLSMTIGS